MGANTTWATASNWLSYDGSLFSVPVSSPTSSSRTIVSAANSCATAQPVLGANTSIGSLILESGATLGLSSYTLTVNGGFTNNGTFTAGTSTVAFTGSGTVGGSSSTTFNNLTINGSSISVVLGANITVQNTLTLTNGKLTTQGYTLLLGSTSANATVSGGSSTAYIVAYKDGATIGKVKQFVNSATSYSFPIGDASNYTPVTYTQTSGTLSNAYLEVFTEPVKVTGLNSAITTYLTRYWDVTSSGMTTPIYTISYTYADGDIVGTEASLLPIKKSQLTTPNTWYKPSQATSLTLGTTEGSGSVNASTNTLTWSGLSTFSLFGGAGDQGVPLPIGLLSFSGKKSGQDNELNWSTATEKNNDFFTVEKTIDGKVFDVVGNVNGSGTTLQKMEYSLMDYNVEKTINYYRLKQTDFDGKTTTTDLISIDNTEKNKVKEISYMTNILGQEVNENFRGLVIIVYTDGTSEKVIR